MATSAPEAAGIVSQYYERPADTNGEITRRAAIAESYGGSPEPKPEAAPVIDLSKPEEWKKIQGELSKSSNNGPGLIEQLESWAKAQRKAPEQYSASDVVTPVAAPAAAQDAPARPAQQVQNVDNRQFHIHGADIGKVKQVLNEEMATLINHTSENFKSAENEYRRWGHEHLFQNAAHAWPH